MSKQDKKSLQLMGLNCSEFAILLGITRQTVSRGVNTEGDYITLDRIIKVKGAMPELNIEPVIRENFASEYASLSGYWEKSEKQPDVTRETLRNKIRHMSPDEYRTAILVGSEELPTEQILEWFQKLYPEIYDKFSS